METRANQVRLCARKMLNYRGFDAITENLDEDEEWVLHGSNSDNGRVCQVYLTTGTIFTAKLLREFCARLNLDESPDYIIVVCPEGVKKPVKRQMRVQQINGEPICSRIHVFSVAEMLFCPVEHQCVPHHEIVPPGEMNALRKRFHVSSDTDWAQISSGNFLYI